MKKIKKIKRLLLFVHPMPRLERTRKRFMTIWKDFLHKESKNNECAVCLIKNRQSEIEILAEYIQNKFKTRAFIDPSDNGKETKLLIADDLQRTLLERGSREEWCPYEMNTSLGCRRIAQGLKQSFKNRGYEYDPNDLKIISCGQEWGGCLTKYSLFVSRYLGYNRHVDIRPNMTPNAGFPANADFLNKYNLEFNVSLFVFRLKDGRLMGQYFDTCRAVWDCTRIAVTDIDIQDINDIEYATYSPFVYLKTKDIYPVNGKVTAAVGDGAYPAVTTICNMNISEDVFVDKLKSAKIQNKPERNIMQNSLGYKEYEVSSCTPDYRTTKWGKY